jgi:type III secretion protein J
MRRLGWALALVALLLLGACKVELFRGLTEPDANDMLAILLRYDISAEKSLAKDGVTLLVEERRFAEAVELLKLHGFPRQAFNSIGDVFKKEGLISSPFEERIRFIYALSQELSQTLSLIDGVLSARVHVVLPESDFGDRDLLPSSAAVFIRHQLEAQLDQLVPQIKMLVTNSIEGLTYDKVTVVLFPVDASLANVATGELTAIGPLQIGTNSVETFWMMVGGLGLLAAAALAGMGYLVWHQRAASQKSTQVPHAAE